MPLMCSALVSDQAPCRNANLAALLICVGASVAMQQLIQTLQFQQPHAAAWQALKGSLCSLRPSGCAKVGAASRMAVQA